MKKSKHIAYLLWFLSIFGWLGFHRLYLHKAGSALLWVVTIGFGGVGALIDFFTLGGQVDLYNTKRDLKKINKVGQSTQPIRA